MAHSSRAPAEVEMRSNLSKDQKFPIKKPIPLEGTGLMLVVPPFFRPHVRFTAWSLEDILSGSTAAPYWCFRRAAPGRVRDPTATGFTPNTGSLRQGILTTPVLSGFRDILTQEAYQWGRGLSNRHNAGTKRRPPIFGLPSPPMIEYPH